MSDELSHEGDIKPVKAVVYLVDDDASSRELMLALVKRLGHEAVGFPTAEDFLGHFKDDGSTPACVVLEASPNGLDVHRCLQRKGSAVPVIFVSGEARVGTAVDAMKSGALDFMTKPLDQHRFIDAVQSAVMRDSVDKHRRQQKMEIKARIAKLTTREEEVMYLLAEGKSTKEIAGKLGINQKTVFVHRARVLEKLEVDNLVALSALVREL